MHFFLVAILSVLYAPIVCANDQKNQEEATIPDHEKDSGQEDTPDKTQKTTPAIKQHGFSNGKTQLQLLSGKIHHWAYYDDDWNRSDKAYNGEKKTYYGTSRLLRGGYFFNFDRKLRFGGTIYLGAEKSEASQESKGGGHVHWGYETVSAAAGFIFTYAPINWIRLSAESGLLVPVNYRFQADSGGHTLRKTSTPSIPFQPLIGIGLHLMPVKYVGISLIADNLSLRAGVTIEI